MIISDISIRRPVLATVVSLLLISVPTFVIGFVLQYVFAVQLGWTKATVGPQAEWGELILPALVLASVSFAYIIRLTRTSVSENMGAGVGWFGCMCCETR